MLDEILVKSWRGLWLGWGAEVVIPEIADTGAEVKELIRLEGGKALFVKTDVAYENSMNRLAKRTLKEFSKVDILVNNATTAKLVRYWNYCLRNGADLGQLDIPRW